MQVHLPPRALWLLACHLLVAIRTGGEVEIRQGPQNKRIGAGHLVRFSCIASARDGLRHGIPTIEWRRDDEIIPFKKDLRFVLDEVDMSLTINNVSTSDTGLYTCIASLKEGIETSTRTASAQLIVEAVPDPPIDVELMQCESRLAQIQWKLISENYSPVLQFIIQFNTSFNPDVWHVAKTQLPRNRFYQRIALSPWANYSFRVIAQNAHGNSRPSKITEKICTMPPDVPHHNPSGVCTKNIRPRTLVITWEIMTEDQHNAPGFYYLVKWRRHDTAKGASKDFHEQIVDKSIDELTVENQPIYKPYEIFVLAINSVGEAVAPPKMFISYSSEDIPLEVVHNFRLDPDKEVTDTTADFLWDGVNTGPWRMQGFFRGYKIQFWKTKVGISTMREHSIIYREPEPCGTGSRHKRDVASGQLFRLWPFTNITAQIVVLNAKYEGPPSKQVYFATKEGEPGPVQQFTTGRRGSNHMEVTWHKPKVINGILVGYTIAYKAVDPVPYDGNHEEEIDLDDPEVNSIKLRGLKADQKYRISIWARSRVGRGQVYDLEEMTLPSGPPVAPEFTATNISKRAINVTWFPSPRGNPGSVFTVHYRKTGQLSWVTTPPETERTWTVIGGLSPGVYYEILVVARNGEGEYAQETSSPTRKILMGQRRDVSQPTFQVMYLSRTSFSVALKSVNPAVTSYYVQFRPQGSRPWRTLDDHPVKSATTVQGLIAGRPYQIRVVAKSDFGESPSEIQEFVAGMDPDALTAPANRCSSFHPTSLLTYFFTVIFWWVVHGHCWTRTITHHHLTH